jgi:PIN domain nuclease of toxin-antitoxin system
MVTKHVHDAAVLAVNLEEVVGILVREGMAAGAVERALTSLALPVVPFTEEMAWRAGRLRRQLPAGLGIADRCCLAAAAVLGYAVITADALWRVAGDIFSVEVLLIR